MSVRTRWRGVAALAGALAFVTLAVMLSAYLRRGAVDPSEDMTFQELKRDLARNPSDVGLQEKLRVEDLQLRRAFFERRSLEHTGGWVLLVCIAAFLVAVKLSKYAGLPAPEAPAATTLPDRAPLLPGTRRAVAAMGIALVAGALAIAWRAPLDLPALPGTPGSGTEPPAAAKPPTVDALKAQWPTFRGFAATGVSTTPAPTEWNGATGEGIVWKTPIGLPGNSSPVIWDSRVFVTAANASREEVTCVDLASGKILWTTAVNTPRRPPDPEPFDEKTGYAQPTAATDGRRVYAMFTNGLVAAFDMTGTQVWTRQFGALDNAYGHSSSLVSFENNLIVQLDHGDAEKPRARLIALDCATGETTWETRRAVESSWSSPSLYVTDAGPQIALMAVPAVIAYHPGTGAEIWRAAVVEGSDLAVSPTYCSGAIYVSHADIGLYAIRADGTGDVTQSHVAWHFDEDNPDVPSPLCDGKRVYVLTSGGGLTCLDAESGEVKWNHWFELEDQADFYASPALAGTAVYCTDRGGLTIVAEAGDTYQEIGIARLGEAVSASFAFAGGRIIVRGEKHLYAIGEK